MTNLLPNLFKWAKHRIYISAWFLLDWMSLDALAALHPPLLPSLKSGNEVISTSWVGSDYPVVTFFLCCYMGILHVKWPPQIPLAFGVEFYWCPECRGFSKTRLPHVFLLVIVDIFTNFINYFLLSWLSVEESDLDYGHEPLFFYGCVE